MESGERAAQQVTFPTPSERESSIVVVVHLWEFSLLILKGEQIQVPCPFALHVIVRFVCKRAVDTICTKSGSKAKIKLS